MASLVKQRNIWYVVYRRDGKQIWRTTRSEDEAEARRVLASMVAVLKGQRKEEAIRAMLEEAGRVPVEATGTPPGSIWEAYVKYASAGLAPRTEASKRARVAGLVAWLGKRHPEIMAVHELSERLAQEYLLSFTGAAQTRNNVQSCLSAVWKVLRVPLGLPGNPWTAVPRARGNSIRKEALSLEQVRCLYAAAQKQEGTFWPAAVALGFYTGLRWGDVCTLSWAEVDLEKGQLRVLPNKAKRRGRVVTFALHGELRRWLEKVPSKRTGQVWPEVADLYRVSDRRLAAGLRRIFAQAGIEMHRDATEEEARKVVSVDRDGIDVKGKVQVYGFHSLRHTYVTLLEDSGLDRETIQTLVGHGSPEMTGHYSHSEAAGRKAAGRLPELVEK